MAEDTECSLTSVFSLCSALQLMLHEQKKPVLPSPHLLLSSSPPCKCIADVQLSGLLTVQLPPVLVPGEERWWNNRPRDIGKGEFTSLSEPYTYVTLSSL